MTRDHVETILLQLLPLNLQRYVPRNKCRPEKRTCTESFEMTYNPIALAGDLLRLS